MIITAIITGLLSAYYFYFLLTIWKGLQKLQAKNVSGQLPGEYVSIIIPFRNESASILDSLKSLERQNYDKARYEVIYVNDNSEDDSPAKILSAEKPENIRVISVPAGYYSGAHKKRAIMYGIEQSRGEIIVSTDCDCVHNENWLITILRQYDKDTGFISGPVRFAVDGSVFSKLQGLEFAGLILAGAGLIGAGQPVICSAANLSYRKAAYNEAGGFNDNLDLSSGDDEFLMRRIAKLNKYGIKFILDKSAIAETNPNSSIEQFYQQRKRWASKSLFYDLKLTGKLILIFLFYISLILQLFAGIFISGSYFITLAAAFIIKAALEYRIMQAGEGILFDKNLLRYFVAAEIIQIPYIVIASIAGAAGNFEWKNRKVSR